ncbi:Hypothetical predicted protein, partial [Pelobates cultripes]
TENRGLLHTLTLPGLEVLFSSTAARGAGEQSFPPAHMPAMGCCSQKPQTAAGSSDIGAMLQRPTQPKTAPAESPCSTTHAHPPEHMDPKTSLDTRAEHPLQPEIFTDMTPTT